MMILMFTLKMMHKRTHGMHLGEVLYLINDFKRHFKHILWLSFIDVNHINFIVSGEKKLYLLLWA